MKKDKNKWLKPGQKDKNNRIKPGQKDKNNWLKPGQKDKNDWFKPGKSRNYWLNPEKNTDIPESIQKKAVITFLHLFDDLWLDKLL